MRVLLSDGMACLKSGRASWIPELGLAFESLIPTIPARWQRARAMDRLGWRVKPCHKAPRQEYKIQCPDFVSKDPHKFQEVG